MRLLFESLEDRAMLAVVSWTGLGDGHSWSNGANWSSAPSAPGQTDDVTIGSTGSPQVTSDGFAIIKSLTVSSGAKLSLTGGALIVSANSTIHGEFTGTNTLVQVSGSGVTFLADGPTNFSDSELDANQGALLNLPTLTSFGSVNRTSYIQAFGDGSQVDLHNLTTLTSTGFNSLQVKAFNGGTVDLSGVVHLAASHTNFNPSGTNSRIDLTALTSVTGQDNLFNWSANASINAPNLATFRNSSINIDKGTASLPALSNIDGSQIGVIDSQLSLPLVTSYTSQASSTATGVSFDFDVRGSTASLSMNNLTNIDASARAVVFRASLGATLNLKGLVSTASGNIEFHTDIQGSTIDLAALTSMTGPGGNVLDMKQSLIRLPHLTTFQGGNITITEVNPNLSTLTNIDSSSISLLGGSVLSLPLVTSYANTSSAEINFLVDRSFGSIAKGTLTLGGLTTIAEPSRVKFSSEKLFGQINLPVLAQVSNNTRLSGSGLQIPAITQMTGAGNEILGEVNAPNLVRFNNGKITASFSGPNLPALKNIDGLSIIAHSGGVILPSVVSYVNTSGLSPTIESDDGLIKLANLKLLDAKSFTFISATNGGRIEFDSLTDVVGRAVFNVQGNPPPLNGGKATRSYLRLPSLLQVTDSQVQLSIAPYGHLEMPNLKLLKNVNIQQTTDPLLQFPLTLPPNLTYLVDTSTVTVQGFVDYGGTLSVQKDGVLALSDLALNGSSALHIDPGATLSVGGSLLGDTTNADQFHPRGVVQALGQFIEAMSADRGPTSAGFEKNFAYGTLDVIGQTHLTDAANNSPGDDKEAVYVDQLYVRSGASLDLYGHNIYARVAHIDGSVVNNSLTPASLVIVPPGTIFSGTATAGTLAQSGDHNQHTFFGRAGQVIAAELNTYVAAGATVIQTPIFYGKVSLIDPDGVVVATASSPGFAEPAALPATTLAKTGNYTIQVQAPDNQPTATGNYLLTYFDVVTRTRDLAFQKTMAGTLANSHSLDLFTFSANPGQQINLHPQSNSISVVKYTLIGPSGNVIVSNLTSDSGPINLPTAGNYKLQVQSASDSATSYSFSVDQVSVIDLPLGGSHADGIGGAGFAQLFKVDVAVNQSLYAKLIDDATADGNELYARLAVPPTRSEFDASATGGNTGNQQLVVTSAATGTWYFLLYTRTNPASSNYSFQVTGQQVLLSDLRPAVRLLEAWPILF
ncbi:MAG: hypothetical protein U0930_21890 [Pirellulales bacterium]